METQCDKLESYRHWQAEQQYLVKRMPNKVVILLAQTSSPMPGTVTPGNPEK